MCDEAILNLNMLVFVFERHHDIELEGYALAGVLIIDFPKSTRRVPDRAQRIATPIIQQLIVMVRAGQLPYDAKVYGWKDDIWPPNSDAITENKAVLKAWADKRVCIGVRASTDGRLSDMTNLTRAKDAVACFMETEERRQRGRHSPSEGRLCVETGEPGGEAPVKNAAEANPTPGSRGLFAVDRTAAQPCSIRSKQFHEWGVR